MRYTDASDGSADVGPGRSWSCGLPDHPQVDVLEGRPGDGQVGHLAGEPARPGPGRTPSASRSPRVRRTPSSVQLTTPGAVSRPPSSDGTATSTSRPRAITPDAVGQRLGLVQVVGGEQHRGAELAQRPDQRPELAARLGVEAGRRLVEEQQRRPADDAQRDVEPAPLAAGERLAARLSPSRSARPARGPRRGRAGRGSRRPAPAPSPGTVSWLSPELDCSTMPSCAFQRRPPSRRVLAEHADLAGVAARGSPRRSRPSSSCRRRWGRAARRSRRGGCRGRARRRRRSPRTA